MWEPGCTDSFTVTISGFENRVCRLVRRQITFG